MSFWHQQPGEDPGDIAWFKWILSSVQLVVFALALFMLALVSYAPVSI